jgi:GINS complex subunit 2
MEVAEQRAFIVGVMDGLRVLGQSREQERRRREEEGGDGSEGDEGEDEEMGLE